MRQFSSKHLVFLAILAALFMPNLVHAQSTASISVGCDANILSEVPNEQVYDECLSKSDTAGVMAGLAPTDAAGKKRADAQLAKAFRFAFYAVARRSQIDGAISSVSCMLANAAEAYRKEMSPTQQAAEDTAKLEANAAVVSFCARSFPDAAKGAPVLLGDLSTSNISKSLDRRARLEAARAFFRARMGRPLWQCWTTSETDSDTLASTVTFANGPDSELSFEIRSNGVVGGRTYRNHERAKATVVLTSENQYHFDSQSFTRISADTLPNGLQWSDPSSIRIQMTLQKKAGIFEHPDDAFTLRGSATDNFGDRPFNCKVVRPAA